MLKQTKTERHGLEPWSLGPLGWTKRLIGAEKKKKYKSKKKLAVTDTKKSLKGTNDLKVKKTKKNINAVIMIQAMVRSAFARMDYRIIYLDSEVDRIESEIDEFRALRKSNKKLQLEIEKYSLDIQNMQEANKKLRSAAAWSKDCFIDLVSHVRGVQEDNKKLNADIIETQNGIIETAKAFHKHNQLLKVEGKCIRILQHHVASIVNRLKDTCGDKQLIQDIFTQAIDSKKRLDENKLLMQKQVTDVVPLYISFDISISAKENNDDTYDDDISCISLFEDDPVLKEAGVVPAQ